MIKRDIELFLGPIIEASGCELWGIEITSGKGKGRILRIFIDAIQGVDLNDCEKISREIDYHFQFESIFSEFGSFEVSSPGLDRRLFNSKQYKGKTFSSKESLSKPTCSDMILHLLKQCMPM